MVKGFIIYKNGKIPFVIDKYRMELFTDDKILNDFMQEHNKKRNYILSGVYFSLGTEPRKITILVEHSLGSTCYLSCYIVENLHVKEGYDEIGIQSSYLDDVFRYKYNYIDLSRTGINFAVDIKEVYSIPFEMGDNTYNLKYCIGHNGNLGLLEDFERKALYEELFEVICEIVCVKRTTVKVAGEDYPYELVKSKFLKLDSGHLEYVMGCMKNTTTKIANIKSYMVTALYNAPSTINHYYQQEVQHDMYGGGWHEKGIV